VINEKFPIPFRSFYIVLSLAALQTTLGVTLISTGYGAILGMSLISDGLYHRRQNPSYEAVFVERLCQAEGYQITMSVASGGLQHFKDAGKGVSSLAMDASKEALEMAGSQLLSNGKNVGRIMATTNRNLTSLAFKYTGDKATMYSKNHAI